MANRASTASRNLVVSTPSSAMMGISAKEFTRGKVEEAMFAVSMDLEKEQLQKQDSLTRGLRAPLGGMTASPLVPRKPMVGQGTGMHMVQTVQTALIR